MSLNHLIQGSNAEKINVETRNLQVDGTMTLEGSTTHKAEYYNGGSTISCQYLPSGTLTGFTPGSVGNTVGIQIGGQAISFGVRFKLDGIQPGVSDTKLQLRISCPFDITGVNDNNISCSGYVTTSAGTLLVLDGAGVTLLPNSIIQVTLRRYDGLNSNFASTDWGSNCNLHFIIARA